jgi:hypothetical protein
MRWIVGLAVAGALLTTGPALAAMHGGGKPAPLSITPPGAPVLTCVDFQHYGDNTWAPKHDVIVGTKAPGVPIAAGKHFDARKKFGDIDLWKVLDASCVPTTPPPQT